MNNIVKEIRNLNLSCKASSPIKLPWRDEMMDPGNQVTLVRVNDDTEYTNPSCKNDGQLEYRRNAKEMDSLPQVTMECPEQTSKRDSNQQDEIIPRKSTRLKQLPLIKYQDFMLSENHTLSEKYIPNNIYEQSVCSASGDGKHSENVYSTTYTNDSSGYTLLSDTNKTSTNYLSVSTIVPPEFKSKMARPPHYKGTVPFTVYHQNIRGLSGKANELLSQLHPTLPHVLCLSEHHMRNSELQGTYIDNYTLGDSYCRTMYGMGGICIYIQKNLNCIKL